MQLTQERRVRCTWRISGAPKRKYDSTMPMILPSKSRFTPSKDTRRGRRSMRGGAPLTLSTVIVLRTAACQRSSACSSRWVMHCKCNDEKRYLSTENENGSDNILPGTYSRGVRVLQYHLVRRNVLCMPKMWTTMRPWCLVQEKNIPQPTL
jgi:hypothetical protein